MLDRKVHMVRQDDQLVVNRIISEKEVILKILSNSVQKISKDVIDFFENLSTCKINDN